MSLREHLLPLNGRYWRSAFIGEENRLLEPAGAPIGRWHHNGQRALYLSETPEGCRVATKVYRHDDDPQRGIFPIEITDAAVIDLRTEDARIAFNAPLEAVHANWAKLNARSEPSPTWRIGDNIRAIGAHGILTPSRSRPDLTHLTLFAWNAPGEPLAKRVGGPILD